MRVVVRPATQDDLEDVLRLYYGFYKELRARQGWPPLSMEEYRKEVKELARRDRILMAFAEGAPVGFVRISEREGCHWLEEPYVVPERRGMGIGRKLVEEAEEYIRERDSAAYIMVLSQDWGAIEFWIHMGYGVLNTIELVKDLGVAGIDSRTFEFFGYPIRIWKWRREDYDAAEREYLNALEEFYRLGGTRRLFLEIVAVALRRWTRGSERTS